MRQVWNDLRPRGMIDLAADIRYQDGPRLLGVTVRAEPHSEITSIEPTRFPYRLENLQGVFTYRDGRVTMERLKAEHQAVKVAAGGTCDFLPDGGWHLRFEGLTVDRLRNDRDLMQAVPERLKKTAGRDQSQRRLQPAGKPRPGRRRRPPTPRSAPNGTSPWECSKRAWITAADGWKTPAAACGSPAVRRPHLLLRRRTGPGLRHLQRPPVHLHGTAVDRQRAGAAGLLGGPAATGSMAAGSPRHASLRSLTAASTAAPSTATAG